MLDDRTVETFYLDATDVDASGTHLHGRGAEKGEGLTRSEALALGELVRRRVPMRPDGAGR